MAFDVNAARKAGYSEVEIAEYLGQQNKFDAAGAIKAGYNPAELISYLSKQAPKESTIGGELLRGAKQVYSSARTGAESLFDANKAATEGIARSEAISKEAGTGPSLDAIKKAYDEKGLLSAAGETASQVPKLIAGQAANVGLNLASTKAGAELGGKFGTKGRIVGGALGSAASLFPQFLGANTERQASEQLDEGKPVNVDLKSAAVGAAGQTALESIGTAALFGKKFVKGLLGVADDAALKTAQAQAELVKAAERSLAASAGRGAIRGATEIPVEIGQQIIERKQAGLDLTSDDALKEYGEAAYQAGLIGGTIGGASGALGRGSARADLEQQRKEQARAEAPPAPAPEPEVVPGAKIPEEAPVGVQGALFTPKEMGKKVVAPKTEPAPEPKTFAELTAERERLQGEEQTPEVRAQLDEIKTKLAPKDEGQLTLGIDFQRDYIDLFKERDRLREGEQTPEVKARIAELTEQLKSYDEADIGQRQAEKIIKEEKRTAAAEQKAADDAAAQRFPGLAGPTTAVITQADIDAMGLPLRTSKQWITDNVLGKTVEEIKALVAREPKLISGKGARADVLKTLISPEPKAFEEKPSDTTTTQTDQPQGELDLGGGESGVGISDKPTGTDVVQPGAGVSTTAETPATPDGLGLAPAGQPAGKRTKAKGAQPPAVTATRTADQVMDEMRALREEQQALLTSSGKRPAVKSKARARWDTLTDQLTQKKTEWDSLDKAERKAKPENAPAPTTPASSTVAPAAPVEKPKKAAKPTPAPTVAKEDKAPPATKAPEPVKTQHTRLQDIIDDEAIPAATRKQAEKNMDLLDDRSMNTSAADRKGNEDYVERFLTRINEALTGRKTPNENVEKSASWAEKYTRPVFNIVFSDDQIGLARSFNDDGVPLYFGVTNTGRYTVSDIESYTGPLFTAEQKAKLIQERAKAVFEESKKFAKNPDGPFTGAATNVVKSESVDQRYADYLHGLMKSLGLSSVRVFLIDPADVKKPGAVEKYKLYKDYSTVIPAGMTPGEDGSKRVYGPGNRDFYISFKPGMSENMTLEVISHELGHAIQNIAYDNAPQETKDAIRKEYEEWLEKTKGKSGRELVQMLRNRETGDTQMMSVAEGKTAAQMHPYWTKFNEWFADNVSRWASTSEKPLSVTEKFFSKVAQMMRDLVAAVTGRKYPPAKTVAAYLDSMGPDDAVLWLTGKDDVAQPTTKVEFSISYGAESLIDTLGPLNKDEKSTLTKWVDQAKSEPDVGYVTKFRTQTADIAATIEKRLTDKFDGAVRDKMGKLNPMGLYRQAQDYTKMLLEYFQTGTLYKDKATGLWMSGKGEGVRPPAEVYALIDKYAEKNGYSRERATQIASRVLEGVRLNEMRRSNKDEGTEFLLHLNDAEIDTLVREFNADPDLQEMSKLMDEARIAMVDNMVKVGRLSAEEGKLWREVVGYVPFDRETIDAVSANFNKVKKISGKGLSQVGKLPELVGSLKRPVGNVFDNYINTLGWMVGQTMKTDATVQTLRSLEDAGFAKFLGRSAQGNPNVVDAYVGGEKMYWSVPSKYDVMAFKDLNPPKAGWLRNMGAFSNILRKTVTILPPFALKQVTDDVQRAILTSGVKNPGALIWMSLTNFPRLAFAELRGIQHPMVRDFGRLGLTGEYDFEAGKPASSLLKDLGYKERTVLGSTKLGALIHRLDGITRASDLAVRKAIYDQTLKESGDALLAQTRAREFINFRRRGASDFVGAMVTTIPFFNAYIQGMDVLYRAASGKDSSASVDRAQARRLFWSRASTVFMLSSLYALGKDDDDEDYKEMDLRTRDSNWILPGGYKIPVPGELGAIFKVIPERIVEYMKRQGTPEEQTAFEAVRTTLMYMYEQYLGRAVPVPQAIKPVMEAWANKSFLTGRDLEGYHHKAMDPSARVTEQTSELAKAIAKFSRDEIGVEVSPIMIDNTLRGYFGSSAAMFTMVTDSLLNPTRVDRPLHKYALLSNYLYDPVGTRRMTEFYEEREKVGKANTTLNELMKTDLVRAEKYAEAHADELMMESAINSTLEQLERTRAYRKYLNSVEGANDMRKEDREAELKEVKQMEMEFVKWVREAQTELRKVQ